MDLIIDTVLKKVWQEQKPQVCLRASDKVLKKETEEVSAISCT